MTAALPLFQSKARQAIIANQTMALMSNRLSKAPAAPRNATASPTKVAIAFTKSRR